MRPDWYRAKSMPHKYATWVFVCNSRIFEFAYVCPQNKAKAQLQCEDKNKHLRFSDHLVDGKSLHNLIFKKSLNCFQVLISQLLKLYIIAMINQVFLSFAAVPILRLFIYSLALISISMNKI